MVEMAIQTEQNGYAFYSAAARQAQSPEAAKLLNWLAGQEQEHEAVFRQMLTAADRHLPSEEYSGQYSAFVQALLESRLLPDKETGAQRLATMTTDDELIDFAIGFEKDTILFMHEMHDMAAPSASETLKRLLAEEKTHLARLKTLRHSLQENG